MRMPPWLWGTRKLMAGANGRTCPAGAGLVPTGPGSSWSLKPGSRGGAEAVREAGAREAVLPGAAQQVVLALVPRGPAVLQFALLKKCVIQVTSTGSGVGHTRVRILLRHNPSCESVQTLGLSEPPPPHPLHGGENSQVRSED